MALVNAAALTDADVAILHEGQMKLIPAFLAGVVPIFTLPSALTHLHSLGADVLSDLGLPELYPLRVDMELAARMFIGEVTSWLDDDLVKLNPQLPVWFTAASASFASGALSVAVDTTMQLVVGATAADDALSGAKLLFQHLSRTELAKTPDHAWAFVAPAETSGPKSNPFLAIIKHASSAASTGGGALGSSMLLLPSSDASTASTLAAKPMANITLIETEARLTIKSSQIPGSVSYRPLASVADHEVEFVFVEALDTSAAASSAAAGADGSGAATSRATISPTVSSMSQCSSRLSSPADMSDWSSDELQTHLDLLSLPDTQRAWVQTNEPGCWPLTTLLSFAVKIEYSDAVKPGSCAMSLHSLEFIN